ncbi:uncharacterized protein LOC123267281 [Cotesia glomerata]|uniref:uncharacterized protein LOC123267281 n=1 Tax=Cotesia glomerata TaxID=32391 RepID=UPI001D0162E2|nr:uncharacterized protein LOC123267281 [Cotesia glomerata]
MLSVLYSDCGTNFKVLTKRSDSSSPPPPKESMEIANLLGGLRTQWKFYPPSAPHFGGKWEAGVKSVKHHLQRVIGDRLLTFEEMSTLLTQIEAISTPDPSAP